jgi:hypothetical protein
MTQEIDDLNFLSEFDQATDAEVEEMLDQVALSTDGSSVGGEVASKTSGAIVNVFQTEPEIVPSSSSSDSSNGKSSSSETSPAHETDSHQDVECIHFLSS